MKIFLILLSIAVFTQEGFGVHATNNQKFGVIKVAIPSFRYDVVDTREDSSVYKIFLKGKNVFKQIPYKGRKINKDKNGNEEYHIDEYEVKTSPGIYQIVVKGFESYRLANFSLNLREVVKFQIPQSRFAVEMVCKDDQLIVKTINSEKSLLEQEKSYKRLPYKKLLIDVLSLSTAFEVVVHYCGKKVKDNIFYYKSAEVYYKNYYISAGDLIINKNTRTLKAIGNANSPTLIQLNGSEIEERKKVTLNLNK